MYGHIGRIGWRHVGKMNRPLRVAPLIDVLRAHTANAESGD
jgi:hypothetical protein